MRPGGDFGYYTSTSFPNVLRAGGVAASLRVMCIVVDDSSLPLLSVRGVKRNSGVDPHW